MASLVHINTSVGRGTAGVDMNAIPAASIKRIEVLRDGAAAQYGSDAIAGVINIVLNDASEGGRAYASYGEYDQDLCPVCSSPPVETCNCGFSDKKCENDHIWYTDREGKVKNGNPHC